MVAAVGLIVPIGGCDDDDGEAEAAPVPIHEYVSRPDLRAPQIDVTTYGPGRAMTSTHEGLIFLAPKEGEPMTGPLIVDGAGEPVWIHPFDEGRSYDFKVQEYAGRPVLTFWRGENVALAHGAGEYVIMDRSYHEIATVTTEGTERADYHGMTLTDRGTALLISYPLVRRDLTPVGGPKDGYVDDGVVQEVDVATGQVRFEWSALDHIPLTDTRVDVESSELWNGTADKPLDYVHLNAVAEDTDGALLISARNTHAVYRVDRRTGAIDWTLGGSSSDFAMAGGATFAWQHDVQRQADGTITLFDNEATPPTDDRSRGLRLRLDPKTRTARVVTEYLPPDGRLAESQGNVQVLPNGHVFIGWGQQSSYSEYTADGRLLLDAHLPSGETYRTFRMPWTGEPSEPPALTVEDGTAYASWNGATEVASWRFLAGDDADSSEPVATVPRTGFETSVQVPDAPYVAVEALDADGQVLATAEA